MKLGAKASYTAALVTTALILTGCAAQEANPGGETTAPTLTIGARGDVASWDPSQSNVNDTQQMFQTAYDTIIRREPDGTMVPMLGTDWEYNDDQTQLTVNLRSDVTFSSGEKFDAESVKANIENLKAGNGPQAATVKGVESVEVVDEDTVCLLYTSPSPRD